MPFARFDSARLRAVPTSTVSERHCGRTEKLIAACRLGAGPANRHWAAPAGPVRIELPFACYQIDDAEVARRACLQLDGSWPMADAPALARLGLRGRALWADIAWWRALQPTDAWDAGVAPDAAALHSFVPRRTTLIVLEHGASDACLRALGELDRRARSWPRAVRVLLLGAPLGTARYLAL